MQEPTPLIDSLLALTSFESLIIVVPTLVATLMLGFAMGRAGRRELLEQQDALREQVERAARTGDEHSKRTIARMRCELDTVAKLALVLPQVARELNRDDLSAGDVPGLILKLADAIFEPRQILLYGMRASGSGGKERVLHLSAHQGMDEIPESLRTVRLGEGKIGWVAKAELDMLKSDWDSLRQTDRLDVPDNHPDMLADVIGPLTRQLRQRQHVFGVLCIGGPRIRPRDPKLMFQMVTNFGSMALVNANNMKTLRSAAHHDGLTRLLNKRCFLEDAGAKSLVECEKSAKPFSVFIFDIDHFKNFNDTNGHPAGDQLLRRMGNLIREHLRPGDLACRYGGEEFVMALPDTDGRAALEQAEAFRVKIESEPFEHRENQPSGILSISGGVATFPADGASVTELIRLADEALYLSKKGGRNRVARFKGMDIGDPGRLPSVLENLDDAVDDTFGVRR